jgi:hypothetical protein
MSRQRTVLIGLGFGVLGLTHILLDRGRAAPAQTIWPIATGVVSVYLASRDSFVSAGRGAKIGAAAGGTGGLVLLLLGPPLLYWMYHRHPSLTPGALALRTGIGMLNAAINNLAIAAMVGLLVAWVFGGRVVREDVAPTGARRSFWRQFRILFFAGLLGVLSLLLVLPEMMWGRTLPPGAPELSPEALAALSLVNPTLLLAIAVAAGVRLAACLGFRSHLAEWAKTGQVSGTRLWHEFPRAVAAGGAVALFVVLLDAGIQRIWGEIPTPDGLSWSAGQLVSGMLYGGVTEELLMRWGLLTTVVWFGWRIVQRSSGVPRPWLVWGAIAVTAILFGAGHLPAAAATMSLTPLLVLRMMVLNALAGVVFGWLYWKYSLEAAMIAHATGHVVFALAHLASKLFLTS